jgi:hypothetical protein
VVIGAETYQQENPLGSPVMAVPSWSLFRKIEGGERILFIVVETGNEIAELLVFKLRDYTEISGQYTSALNS